MRLTFVHGWGMDRSIWSDIVQYFPDDHCSFVDLGFIGDNRSNDCNIAGKSIYITHSLGTIWALKNLAQNMSGLIAINGFTNFLNFTDERTLRLMQKGLKRNPDLQMQSFWKNCGINNDNSPFDKQLNIDKLHDGLKYLANQNATNDLHHLPAPILSLYSEKDIILPYNQMEKEWSGFNAITIKAGDHILPLSNPKWCASKIKEFISELELEE